MDRRKILIIGHNPISKGDNVGRTMGNIFSNYDKDELCQIYLRDGEPDFSICDQYFYFNEIGILKSILKRNYETGYSVKQEDFGCENSSDNIKKVAVSKSSGLKSRIYEFGRGRTELIYLLRNIMWTLGKWDTSALRSWVKKQEPTSIFFFAGDYYFLFKIVEKIADEFNIPVYVYHVDEYYFTKKLCQKPGIDARIYAKHFKRMYDKAKMTFCISELMKDEYQTYFKKETELLSNTSVNLLPERVNNSNVLNMNYFGNLSYQRWENLSLISTAVRILNERYDRKINFNIYSGEKSSDILDPFLKNPDVNFKGRISQEEVAEKIKESDILVHVESFDPESIVWVKHSVSTKVPDMLASNRLIFALGPKNVACINYLQKHKTGVILNADNIDRLVEEMKCLYENDNFDEYKKNARELYYENHFPKRVKEILDKYL